MSVDSKRFQFLRLAAWREGRTLYRMVSRLAPKFPREELFGLTAPMRRSARAVCAHVAEGSGRNSGQDFARFVETACGPAAEAASDAFPARDEGCVTAVESEQVWARVETVVSTASGLYRELAGAPFSGAPRSALRLPRRAGAP
jgi:four helix bundle protein